MEEANALLDTDLALKPMLELASSSAHSNASMLRTVALKAISDPKVFCGFDDIKSVLQPGLSAAGAEGEVIARTLDLFSYGTYGDYKGQQQPELFLTLSDTHIFKLRQLTILTLVEKACLGGNGVDENTAPTAFMATQKTWTGGCCVSYHALAQALGFTNPMDDKTTTDNALDDAVLRQVEELVLSCVYARVVAGQLCQKSAALYVSSRHGPPCRPRDVPLSQQGATMLATLKQFHQGRLQEAKSCQDKRQQEVQTQMDRLRTYYKAVLERTKKAEQSSSGASGHGGNKPVLIGGGGGGSVRGWSAEGGQDERRMSDVGGSARGSTSRGRQSKRSRGGVGGAMDTFSRY